MAKIKKLTHLEINCDRTIEIQFQIVISIIQRLARSPFYLLLGMVDGICVFFDDFRRPEIHT